MRESLPMTRPDDTPAPAPDGPQTLWGVVRRDLRVGVMSGLQTFWELARVMIPAYGVTLLLQYLGVIDLLARGAGRS